MIIRIYRTLSLYIVGNLLLDELKAMHTDQNVTIGIHLQEIAVQGVEPEATHRKCWIIVELQYLLGITHGN